MAPSPKVAESDSWAMLPTLATIIIARAGQAISEIGTRPTSPDAGGPLVGACAAMSPAFVGVAVVVRRVYLVVSVASMSDTRSS